MTDQSGEPLMSKAAKDQDRRILTRGCLVVLVADFKNGNTPQVKLGTKGRVLATRKTETDDKPQALVKFEGMGWPYGLDADKLKVIDKEGA